MIIVYKIPVPEYIKITESTESKINHYSTVVQKVPNVSKITQEMLMDSKYFNIRVFGDEDFKSEIKT